MTRANKAKLFDSAINFVDSTRSNAQPSQVAAPKQTQVLLLPSFSFSSLLKYIIRRNQLRHMRLLFSSWRSLECQTYSRDSMVLYYLRLYTFSPSSSSFLLFSFINLNCSTNVCSYPFLYSPILSLSTTRNRAALLARGRGAKVVGESGCSKRTPSKIFGRGYDTSFTLL